MFAGLLMLLMVLVGLAVGLLVGRSLRAGSTPQGRCPMCNQLRWQHGRCDSCGWTGLGSREDAQAHALSALSGQVWRLAQQGWLAADVRQRLLGAVEQEQARLQPGFSPANRAQPVAGEPIPVEARPAMAAVIGRIAPPVDEPANAYGARPPQADYAEEPPVDAVDEEVVEGRLGAEQPILLPTREPAPIPERAQRYAESGERHRQEQAAATNTAATKPNTPSNAQPWQWLAAFMEERNVRWGELIGGLLIVSCSIALVISFWGAIAERPWLKFVVFNGVTAALFGLGNYVQRHWKLPTTSRGILVIASLLVPLNFLAIAAMSQGAATASPLLLLGEAASLLLFGWLLWMAGGHLVGSQVADTEPHESTGGGRLVLLLVAGVLVPCAIQLFLGRWVTSGVSAASMYLLVGALISAAAAGPVAWSRATADQSLSEANARRGLRILGLVTFATIVTLGLTLYRWGGMTAVGMSLAAARLSPLLTLLCFPTLLVGMRLGQIRSRELASLRVVGTVLTLAAAVGNLYCVSLAWPHPAMLLPTALLNIVALTILAWRWRLPWLHYAAAGCLFLAGLISHHLMAGNLAWFSQAGGNELPRQLFSLESGYALFWLTLLMGLISAGAGQGGRRNSADDSGKHAGPAGDASRPYAHWALAALVLGPLLLLVQGPLQAIHPAGLGIWLAAYAGLYLLGGMQFQPVVSRLGIGVCRGLAQAGALLLFAAIAEGLVFHGRGWLVFQEPWLAATLTFALLSLALAIGVKLAARRHGNLHYLGETLADAALVANVISFGLWGYVACTQPLTTSSAYIGPLAVIWLVLALYQASWPFWLTFQWLLALTVVFHVAASASTTPWYLASPRPWLEMRMLQALGIAVGLYCLGWVLLRVMLRRARARRPQFVAGAAVSPWQTWVRQQVRLVLASARWQPDHVLGVGVLLVASVVAGYAALPGAAQELAPRALSASLAGQSPTGRIVADVQHFEVLGVPHAAATSSASWILLATVAAWLLAGLWERFSAWRIWAFVAVVGLAAPLAASFWEADVAVASALRWSSAAVLLFLTLGIWNRTWLARCCSPLGWRGYNRYTSAHPSLVWKGATAVAYGMALLPLAAMVAFVGAAAVQRFPTPPLLAAWLSDATMLAWLAALIAVALLAGSWLLRHAAAGQTTTLQSASSAEVENHESATWAGPIALLIFILGVSPAVIVGITWISQALQSNPITGPNPASFFATAGLAVSYVTPALLIAATLVGCALRERSAGFAFIGGLALNLCGTAGYLLTIKGLGVPAEMWLKVAYLNALVAAVYAWGWTTVAWGVRQEVSELRPVSWLQLTYTALPLTILAAVLGPRLGALYLWPDKVLQWPVALTGGWAWSAAALALAAMAWLWMRSRRPIAFHLAVLGLVEVGFLAAFAMRHWDVGNWFTFHTVQMVLVATAWALGLRMLWLRFTFAGAYLPLAEGVDPPNLEAQRSLAGRHFRAMVAKSAAVAMLILATLWSLRSWLDDPVPAWAVAALLLLAALAATIAATVQRHKYVYLSGALFNLAVMLAWVQTTPFILDWSSETWLQLLAVNSMALCAPAVVWALMTARRGSRFRDDVPHLHAEAGWLGLAITAYFALLGLKGDAFGTPAGPGAVYVWGTFAAAAWALAAGLWNRASRHAGVGLYLLGLVGLALVIDSLDQPPRMQLWLGVIFVGSYALASSYVGSRFLQKGAPIWLIGVNQIMATVVVLAAIGISLTFNSFTERVIAAQAGLVQAVTLGLLSRRKPWADLQPHALALFAAGALALGWSVQPLPEPGEILLQRSLAAMVSLGVVSLLYGLGFGKFLPKLAAWTPAARKLLPWLLGSAAVALFLVLEAEVRAFLGGEVPPLGPGGIAIVMAVLAGLAAAAIVAAVVPGRDPFNWPERQRMGYVYAAEGLLAILLMHVRVTMPWLFTGFFSRYWPLVAMAVAFAGLSLAEIFRRQQRNVLAEPLERTGALLPLLTVLAFWAAPSQADFGLVLLAAGSLYAGCSVLRKSFAYGIAATVAANGALWFWLHGTENWGIAQHPQLWLIPPALCLLAAGHWNRKQLDAGQAAALRYAASLAIYVSSTADVFLNGVAEAPWLPLVLGGLSVLGIFAGIALQVRGFLYLGTSFLLLALGTMVWYAAVDLQQTWVWYASGIVLGVAILLVFALFEKKRLEVLHLVDHVRKWQA